MRAIVDDTIEALLDDLDIESMAVEPEPRRPLQNALPKAKPALSVIVAATGCSRELLRTLGLITEAGEELFRRLGKKTEIVVAVYGAESRDTAGRDPGEKDPAGMARGARPVSPVDFASAEEFDAKIVSRNLPNRAAAMNAAAAIAEGRILVFLRSNLAPRKECLCHILDATANRRSLGGGTNVAAENKSVASRLATMISRLPLRLNGVSLGMTFVRKNAFRRLGGFRETMFSGEAIEFALRLKKHALSAGKEFSNITAVCATRYGEGAFWLSPKEWLLLFVSPLIWYNSPRNPKRITQI